MSGLEQRGEVRRTFYSSGNQFVGAASFSGRGAEAELSNHFFPLLSSPLSLLLFIFYMRNVADGFEAHRIKMSVC